MHTGKTGARDFFGVIRAASGEPTVAHAHHGKAAELRFFDGQFHCAVHRVKARIVATIHARRYGRFVFNADRAARLFEIDMLGNRKHARQPQRRVAAQFGIDQAGRNDAGFLRTKADVLERAYADRIGFHQGEHHGCHWHHHRTKMNLVYISYCFLSCFIKSACNDYAPPATCHESLIPATLMILLHLATSDRM